MAINKELYERYKAMKAAKGANVVTGNCANSGSNSASSGFKALSSTSSAQSHNSYSAPEQNVQTQQITQETTTQNWNNTYSNMNSNQLPQSTSVESYSSSSVSYQPNEEIKAGYSSQFVGMNEKIQTTQPYTPSEPAVPYTGNVQSTTEHQTPNVYKFALIGCPLGHSLSEYIHLAGFESLGIKATYELIETPPEKLVDTIKYLKTSGYSGFNVTIPLKLPVTMFLDEIDPSANTVNAINTVMIDPQTKFLKGYNTDVAGFDRAIPKDIDLCGKVAGILGTGGAARAAIASLAMRRVRGMKLYTRNVSNTIELLNYLRKTYPQIEFNSYPIERIRDLSDIDILVNATPIGMAGISGGYSPVEENELRTLPAHALVYDVIYNPKKTLLIKLAQKYHYRTVTGMDMLVYQAVEAQKIWTGRTPDFKDMKIAALENI